MDTQAVASELPMEHFHQSVSVNASDAVSSTCCIMPFKDRERFPEYLAPIITGIIFCATIAGISIYSEQNQLLVIIMTYDTRAL